MRYLSCWNLVGGFSPVSQQGGIIALGPLFQDPVQVSVWQEVNRQVEGLKDNPAK